MPSSHSKRNTSRSDFTSYERSLLRDRWGSKSKVLSHEAFLPFGSCNICLHPAVDPVACAGYHPTFSQDEASMPPPNKKRKRAYEEECHLFCRECAYTSILAQKKEIERVERERKEMLEEQREVEGLEREEAKKRAMEDFERAQTGAEVSGRRRERYDWGGGGVEKQEDKAKNEKTENAKPQKLLEDGNSGKRKREDLDEAMSKANDDDEARARRKIEDEKEAAAGDAAKENSFWVPGKMPDQKKTTAPEDSSSKLQPLCPGSEAENAHTLSRKLLVNVQFHEESSSSQGESQTREGKTRICPACSKPLSNSTKAVLAKPCGHVVCVPCVDKFVAGAGAADGGEDIIDVSAPMTLRCYVCSADVTGSRKKKDKEDKKSKEKVRPGLAEISTDGTGYASGGNNFVRKKGIAFQC